MNSAPSPEPREPARPSVSLIICTRNRAQRLRALLESLEQLETPPGDWELILVDNASTDGTSTVLEEFARSSRLRVVHLFAPRPGLARARNVGLAAATGRIVAFTDDDCYPRPDYLRAVLKVFADDPGLGFVGGRVLLHDPTDAGIGVLDSTKHQHLRPFAFFVPGTIHGANMAVAREVVEAIGGFDPLLGAGTPCRAGEDTEYLARCLWAGWRGRYDPGPVVAHHHGRKPGEQEAALYRSYALGRGAYYARLILARRSWRRCLRRWYSESRNRGFDPAGLVWLAREVAGALLYLRERVVRRETAPRISDAAGHARPPDSGPGSRYSC